MKKLLGLGLVVAAAIFGYTHFLHVPPASAEESALGELEHRFEAARQAVEIASRSAGATGLDTASDIETARIAVRRAESDLQTLRGRLDSASARRRADLLQERITDFRRAFE